jgi:putative selenium metabolism protein SsnA
MNLLITDVTLFTNDETGAVLNDYAVAVVENRIAAIGPQADLLEKHPDFKRLSGSGRLLMPGLINTHMHFYGTYARGLALRTPPRYFPDILTHLWWALDKVLNDEAIYFSALVPAITAVKHGVTAVIDHHASPHAIAGSLDQIQSALTEVGLRGVLCYEVSDRDGKEIRDAGLVENERFIRQCQTTAQINPDYPFHGMVGLHASFTLDDDSLAAAAEVTERTGRGVHIHLLEDRVDYRLSLARFHSRPVARLARFGLLGPQSIAAHGIYLNEEETEQLAASDTIVAHNAQSNMNNAVGRADVFDLLDRGMQVGIGTDGMTPDVRSEVRTGYLMHKHTLNNPTIGWEAYRQMLFQHNPAIYRQLTGQQVGVIAPGYLADMILVDYYPPTPMNGDNFWGHFLFGIVDAPVDTTIINGHIVMQNKTISHLDEPALAATSRQVAEQVWKRFHS